MARIQIADLPLLQDLSPEQLKELFGAGPRGYKPSFEALEDRTLRSITPFSASILANVNASTTAYVPVASVTQPAPSVVQTDLSSQVQTGAVDAAVQDGGIVLIPANPGGSGSGSLTTLDLPLAPGLSANYQGVVEITQYVAAHLQELGSPFPKSSPQGTIQPTPDGNGLSVYFYKSFGAAGELNTGVFWSANTHAHAVSGNVLAKYIQLGPDMIGYPTMDTPNYMGHPGEYTHITQDFLGAKPGVYGAITDIVGQGTFEVHGAIYLAWRNGPNKALIPLSNENLTDYHVGSVQYNIFVDPATGNFWDICFVPGSAGANLMNEGIFGKWLDLGGVNYGSPVGNTKTYSYPKGDVYSQNFVGGPNIGSEFEGTIAWTPWAGAHEIHGVVRDVWSGAGPSDFGFPITDEIDGQSSPWMEGFPDYDDITWDLNITLNPETGDLFVIYALDSDSAGPPDSWMFLDLSDPHPANFPDGTPALPDRILPDGSTPRAIWNNWNGIPGENVGSSGQADTIGSPGPFVFGSPGTFSVNEVQLPSALTGLPGNLSATEPFSTGQDPYSADPLNLSPDFLAALATPNALPPEYAWLPTEASALADFTNMTFALVDDNGSAHQLQILAQAPQPDGSATFTGAWDGEDASGTLASDADGNVYVTFSTDSYSFYGTISGDAGAYHLDGTFTDADGNAMHVAGDQNVVSQVSDFTNVSFSLTDDAGTGHQLQILAQAPQPDGSATFTGVWDGEDASGTLASDAGGNVYVTFSTDSYSFYGTLSGDAGAYHLDGTFTDADGNAMHVAGDQDVVSQVSDFTNVSFSLTDDAGTGHQLQILAQAPQPDGSATFTGVWDGEDASGTLASDAGGNVYVTFSTDSYSFYGTLSGDAGAYHLDGTFTDADGNAMHVAGDQDVVSQVNDFTNASFSLTDDAGTGHQLQILAQTPQPDGSATFTGVWDGEDASGTLAYDADGNVYVTFSTDSYTFYGTLSGDAGAYHLDGTFTDADGNAMQVAGDQITQVSDLSNVSFSLTDDNGAVYQLQIQTQTSQTDGTASFTGVWFAQGSHAGEEISGALTCDGAGNVSINFDYGHGATFAGTISGDAGAYHIDGNVTALGADPVHAAGDQSI